MTDRDNIALMVFRGEIPPQFENLSRITALSLIFGALSGIWGWPGAFQSWVMREVASLSSPSALMAFVTAPIILSLGSTVVLASILSRTRGPVRSREASQAVLFALNMWLVGACASGISWTVYSLAEGGLPSAWFFVTGVSSVIIAIWVARPVIAAYKALFPSRSV